MPSMSASRGARHRNAGSGCPASTLGQASWMRTAAAAATVTSGVLAKEAVFDDHHRTPGTPVRTSSKHALVGMTTPSALSSR